MYYNYSLITTYNTITQCYSLVIATVLFCVLGNFPTGRGGGSEEKERREFEGVTVRKGIHPFLQKLMYVPPLSIDMQTYIAADTVHVVQQPQYVCTLVVKVQLCIFDMRCAHY